MIRKSSAWSFTSDHLHHQKDSTSLGVFIEIMLSHKSHEQIKLCLIDSRQQVVLDGRCVALPWRLVLFSISSVDDDWTVNEIFDDAENTNKCLDVAAVSEWNKDTQVEQYFTEKIRLADLWPPTWDDEAVIVQCWQCGEI